MADGSLRPFDDSEIACREIPCHTASSATAAAPPTARDWPIRSFWMGGFEGADHLNSHGAALDMTRANGHIDRLDEDYAAAAAKRAKRSIIRSSRRSTSAGVP